MVYMIIQYGLELVLIQRILIRFKALLETFFIIIYMLYLKSFLSFKISLFVVQYFFYKCLSLEPFFKYTLHMW